MYNIKLRTWLTFVVPIVILVSSLAIMFIGRYQISHVSQHWKDVYALSSAQDIQSKINSEAEKAKVIVETLLKNEDIVATFAEKDRDKLIELSCRTMRCMQKNLDYHKYTFILLM